MQYATVTSYPNYEVCSLGFVRNKITGRILTPLNLTKGYQGVRLYNSGNGKTHKIHRLVALAFVSGHFEGAQVNHKDGNKENNCSSNLEWMSNSDNHEHAIRTGLWSPNYTFSQMTRDRVIELSSQGVSQRKISEMTRVSKSHVQNIIKLTKLQELQ